MSGSTITLPTQNIPEDCSNEQSLNYTQFFQQLQMNAKLKLQWIPMKTSTSKIIPFVKIPQLHNEQILIRSKNLINLKLKKLMKKKNGCIWIRYHGNCTNSGSKNIKLGAHLFTIFHYGQSFHIHHVTN